MKKKFENTTLLEVFRKRQAEVRLKVQRLMFEPTKPSDYVNRKEVLETPPANKTE